MNGRPDLATPFAPLIVHDQGDLATALLLRRDQLGMTGEDLDAHAGFQERYAAKLENPHAPWGRGSLRIRPPCPSAPAGNVAVTIMGSLWLDALGLKLVVMPAAQAEAIGALPCGPKPSAEQKREWGQGYRFGKKRSDPRS